MIASKYTSGFILPSVLVLALFALVSQAQPAPPPTDSPTPKFDMVYISFIKERMDVVECTLSSPLTEEDIRQQSRENLQCMVFPSPDGRNAIDCGIGDIGLICQRVKSVCDNLKGQITLAGDSCEELKQIGPNQPGQ